MHNEALGKLINDRTKKERDAIHIAIAPMVAGQDLNPGQHITLKSKGSNIAVAAKKGIGIVDPFLKTTVAKGQEFWMCLYPNTIKSLKHVWEHDEFVEPPQVQQKSLSQKWLEDYAEELDMTFNALMLAADRHLEYGDYHIFHGISTPDVTYRKNDEFWKHYEIVKHVVVDENDKENFFSCSC